MATKNIKVASVWVNEEKEITSKKDGKKYKLVEVNIKIADDSKAYPGKYTKGTFFAYNDLKDPKKNRTAQEKADKFKKETEGKEILVDITEEKYVSKEGVEGVGLLFKTLSKTAKEAYLKAREELMAEMKDSKNLDQF